MNFSTSDVQFMAEALDLASLGAASCMPNPQVGCLLVNNGQIVGRGWHQQTGGPHAEVFALQEADELAVGATAYVTLEPCSHQGRTPPCADALIAAGVQRVVIALQDPYPEVSGSGIKKLQQAGINVESGLLSAEARWQNRGFVCRNENHRPWVRLKMATTLDGRTALANGESQWITTEQARADVQEFRARSGAILTGIGTVMADQPRMTVRLSGIDRQPLRIILDSHWQIPVDAPILSEPGNVMIVGLENTAVPEPLAAVCEQMQHECIALPASRMGIDVRALLSLLAERQINEVQVEAGANLAGTFITEGLIDELVLYQAPKVMGDKAKGMFAFDELLAMDQVMNWHWHDISRIGNDLRLTLTPAKNQVE